MNFIEELKDRKERKENLEEMVLEGIEDEYYKYFINVMLTKCLKDFFEENNTLQENSNCNLYLLIIKNKDNTSHLRLIHESHNPEYETWYHRPLKLNLNDSELEFFINHIIDTFKSYNIEFEQKESNLLYDCMFNKDNKKPIKTFVSHGQIKDITNLYYQELQKIEYETNTRKSK